MSKFAYLCVFLVVGEQYAAGSPVTEYEYIQEAGALLRLNIVPATWQDAGLRCYLEGGILASPATSAMATAMTSMMKAHKLFTRSVFTGIHDHSSKGEFTSLDGTPLANMSLEWAEGQPDNADNSEDCLALTGAGALADVSCGSVHPYFCRKEAPASVSENAPASASENAPASASESTPVSASENAPASAAEDAPASAAENASLTINKCGKEGYEYEPRTSSCYKFHIISQLWHQALHICHTEGGHLAIINSDMESQVLKEMLEKYHDDITGAHNINYALIGIWEMYDTGSKWLTIHGETLEGAGFDKWSENEPNHSFGGKEHCGSIYKDGLLNDIHCGSSSDDQTYPYICELKPQSTVV